jgi:hypothetical protein
MFTYTTYRAVTRHHLKLGRRPTADGTDNDPEIRLPERRMLTSRCLID